jgi:hypothetical protein
MPTKAYAFGEWTPDLSGNVLTRANNVLVIGNGYRPVKDRQAITTTLGGAFLGGGSFVASDHTSWLLAARDDLGVNMAVDRWDGAAWINVYTWPLSGRMKTAQFGDNIVFCNGTLGIYVHDMITDTPVGVTDGPTGCIDVAAVRDFVMVLTDDNYIQWCQFNDVSTWTLGVNQADRQPSLWGTVRKVVGGEYGIILTDKSVVRATYVGVEGGLDIIFQFDEISQEVGVMAESSVCNVGRLIFFLSERGFMMCDGQEVTPIADEKFNRWFFETYSRSDIANIWSAIDPRNSLALWAMPGTPGKIIAYNWVLKRASVIEIDVNGLLSGYSTGVPLDSLDAVYGDLDSVSVSLDDPSLQGGNPVLMLACSDDTLYALTGDNLEATLRLDNIEPTPGRRSRIRAVRLISDANSASATIDARMRIGDAEGVKAASTMRTNGKMPIRANGRYNTLEVTIPAGADWSFIQGCEIESEAGDGR